MKIALLVEGDTEKAFMPVLREWLGSKVAKMPEIKAVVKHGRIAKEDKLKGEVQRLLSANGFDYVIALTDVYTGTGDFNDATDAKAKMRAWVGEESRFFPHAAQHDFEAWLLPFWSHMQQKAGHNKTLPKNTPFEQINHGNPPAHRLDELFALGKKRKYSKPREPIGVLTAANLEIAAQACPELKALLNTFLRLCDAPLLT